VSGAVGRRKSGPASGLVRLKLFCVLIFSFFFIKACPEQRSVSGEKGHKRKERGMLSTTIAMLLDLISLHHPLQKLPNLPSISLRLISQLKLLKLMPLMIHGRIVGPGMESGGVSVKKQPGGLF
jgi:hypothetical protein